LYSPRSTYDTHKATKNAPAEGEEVYPSQQPIIDTPREKYGHMLGVISYRLSDTSVITKRNSRDSEGKD